MAKAKMDFPSKTQKKVHMCAQLKVQISLAPVQRFAFHSNIKIQTSGPQKLLFRLSLGGDAMVVPQLLLRVLYTCKNAGSYMCTLHDHVLG